MTQTRGTFPALYDAMRRLGHRMPIAKAMIRPTKPAPVKAHLRKLKAKATRRRQERH